MEVANKSGGRIHVMSGARLLALTALELIRFILAIPTESPPSSVIDAGPVRFYLIGRMPTIGFLLGR